MRSQQFATRAIPFLVDMLNDENEEVRINTINSLRKMEFRVTF